MIEPTDEMVVVHDATFARARARGESELVAEREALAAVLAIVERDAVGPLRDLLAQLVDDDPCWLDHHGYCQAHGLHSAPCPHQVAKEFLGGPS